MRWIHLGVLAVAACGGSDDGVLLVVDARRSRRRNVRRAVQTLRAVQAPLLGLVFNRARVHASEYGYYGSMPVPSQGTPELTP